MSINERDQLIVNWQMAKQAKDSAVTHEKQLREQVVETAFPDVKKGTQRLPLGGGYNLKAVATEIFKVDKDQDGSYASLINVLGQLPAHVAATLIKWKPEVSTSAYKQLSTDEIALVSKVITISTGSITLELEEPKKK